MTAHYTLLSGGLLCVGRNIPIANNVINLLLQLTQHVGILRKLKHRPRDYNKTLLNRSTAATPLSCLSHEKGTTHCVPFKWWVVLLLAKHKRKKKLKWALLVYCNYQKESKWKKEGSCIQINWHWNYINNHKMNIKYLHTLVSWPAREKVSSFK